MIVDDEPFNISAIKSLLRILKIPDFERVVHEGMDGTEAVHLVEQAINEGDPNRYALILTDCSMPIMDGF